MLNAARLIAFLALWFLAGSLWAANVCTEAFTLRETACAGDPGAGCTNKGSSLTYAELDADLQNTILLCLMDTEAELEGHLSDVTNILTDNDGGVANADPVKIDGTDVTDTAGVDLQGGTGIDFAFNAGASPDTAQANFDSSELSTLGWSDNTLASATWTWQLDVVTDPQISFSNNAISVTAGQLYQDGSVVVDTGDTDTVTTTMLDDAADTPSAGECIVVGSTTTQVEYITCPGAGGGDSVSIDGVAATDPDFRSEGDVDAIRCTGVGAPDASCLAAEDVLYRMQPDAINAISEIDAGIKRGPDATDTHLVTTDVAAPGALTCTEMDTDGSLVLAAGACSTGSHFSPTDIDTDYGIETVTSAWTVTGDWDFGGGGLEIENNTVLPGSCTTGQVFQDTDATSGQQLYACEAGSFVQQGGAGSGDVTDVGDCTGPACFTPGSPDAALTFDNATSGTVTLQTVAGALGTVTASLPAETGTICTTGSVCSGYDPTGGDDLSNDNPTALSGVTTMTDGSYCQGNAATAFDCDVLQSAIAGADHIDAMSEIAAGVKLGPDATDDKFVTTDATAPAGIRCAQIDTDGSLILATDTCANLGPGGTTSLDAIADAGAGGSVEAAEWAQDWNWTSGTTTAAALEAFRLTWTYPSTVTTDSGTQTLFGLELLDNAGDATGQIENVLLIDNNDANDAPTYGLRIDDTQPWGGSALLLPLQNDATTPTLAFGDGNTGAYEASDNVIGWSFAGTLKYQFDTSVFQSTTTGGASMGTAASTLAQPAFHFRGDPDGGLHRPAANQVSLVAGGDEVLRGNVGATGVTYLDVTPGATGVGPTMVAAGEANLDLIIGPAGTGKLDLDGYGSGTKTGTDAYWLAVQADGTVIEEAAPAGTGDVTAVGAGCATGECLTDGLATTGTTIFVWEGNVADTEQVTFAMSSAEPAAAYTLTFPDETGTVCSTGSVCTGYDPTGGDDLSDDNPTALQNVTTINDGDYCQGNASSGFDCDVTAIPDADVDNNITIDHSAAGTLTLDQTVAPTTEGVIAWDATNDELEVGETTTTAIFKQVGTFNDEQFCTAEATGNQIDCDLAGSLADDDLSDDLITALSGVTTVTDGSYCQGGAASSMDCDVTQANIPGAGHIDALSELGAMTCTGDQYLARNTGNTAWECVAEVAGGGDVTAVGSCADGECFTDGDATAGTTLMVWEGNVADAEQVTFAMSSAEPAAAYTLTFPDETGTICSTGSICTGYDPTGGDDLSDDLPTALSNVTTINDGDYCQGNAGGGFDCDVTTLPDADVDNNITIDHTTAGTLTLDADVGPTAEGQAAWDGTNNELEIGHDGVTAIFKRFETFTDENFCTAESTGNQVDCNVASTGTGSVVLADSPVITTAITLPTGSVDDNDLAAGAVDGGTGGEIEDGTITAADVAASLDTRKAFHAVITDPDPAGVNFVFRLPPFTGTMTQFDCESYGTACTSVTVDVCDGEDFADDTCTTSILGATLACNTTGVTDSTLSATGFTARDKVSLVLTAESGTCDRLEVYMTATVD